MKTQILLLFPLLLLLSCEDSPFHGNGGCDPGPFSACERQVVIDAEKYVASIASSTEGHITSVNLAGNCLTINFNYGGCGASTKIELYDRGVTYEVLPRQRDLALRIEHAGFCYMLITDELSFDLTPIQSASTDKSILNLEGWEEQITYVY